MKKVADELRGKGIQVTSTWMEEPHAPNTQMSEVAPELITEYAYRNLLELSQANLMVFFSVDPTVATLRGGHHVEFGYALGIRKPIVVVGPKENIFHNLSDVRHFETWPDALYFLERKHKRRIL